MGVYQIKNHINGKVLIGSNMNLPGKINSHQFQLNHGAHPNKLLQEDWVKYGKDTFSFDILETIKPEAVPQEKWREAVLALEEKWLEKIQPYEDKGYNTQKVRK